MGLLRFLSLLMLNFILAVAAKHKRDTVSYGEWKDNWNATKKAYIVPLVLSSTDYPKNGLLTILSFKEELEATACIELQLFLAESTPTTGDYLEIHEIALASEPCEPSAFGKTNPGKNEIVYAKGCAPFQIKSIILAHLGMRFTHQRTDRDQHVVITPQNINSLLIDIPQPPAHSLTPYDFKSVMSLATVGPFFIYKFDPDSQTIERVPNNLILSPGDGVVLLDLYYNGQCPIEKPCSGNDPCQNGGKCFDQKLGNPYCACTEYYEGENCTDRIVQCKSDSCKNGGTCIEGSGHEKFKCKCNGTFTGRLCEYDLLLNGWFAAGNGYQYRLTSKPGHWYAANRECKILNAGLAHDGIRDPATFGVLNQQYTGEAIWIGAAAQYVSHYYWNDNPGKEFLKPCLPSMTIEVVGFDIDPVKCGDFVAKEAVIEFAGTWHPWGLHQPTPGDNNHCAVIKELPANRGPERALANLNCNTELHGLCEKFIGDPLTFGTYRPGNGGIYFKTPAPTNYRIAMEQCQERGAHLIVFGADTSEQLKNIVDNVFGDYENYIFVGYEDFGSRRSFKSVIGDKILPRDDERWADDEPSRRRNRHNAVVTSVGLNGKLRDINDKKKIAYGLCEAPDQPEQPECDCANGRCVKDSAGFEICVCTLGYAQDPEGNCIDYNECTASTDSCDFIEECINLPGSFLCVPIIFIGKY